jgi:D-aminoacyl-tRNA deacylase
MKIALMHLLNNREKYDLENCKVSFEATHHGPIALPFPVAFVEIGSNEERWTDPTAGRLAAEAIIAAATTEISDEAAVGFGGGHYAPKQTRVTIEQPIAVGHTIAKYALEHFDEQLFRTTLEKTRGKCRKAVIDWKGVRGDVRRSLEEAASTWGVEVIRA